MENFLTEVCTTVSDKGFGPAETVVLMGFIMTALRGLSEAFKRLAEKTSNQWDNRAAYLFAHALKIVSWAFGIFSAGALKSAPMPPAITVPTEKQKN